jgi:hypothetical protein
MLFMRRVLLALAVGMVLVAGISAPAAALPMPCIVDPILPDFIPPICY